MDAPVAQIERFLDLLGPRDAIGQEKGGPQGEDCRRRLSLMRRTRTLFARAIAVVKRIALRPRLRKQFRMLCDIVCQVAADTWVTSSIQS